MNFSHPDRGFSESPASDRYFPWLSDAERGEATVLIGRLRKSLLDIIHRDWSSGPDMWSNMRKVIFQSKLPPPVRRTITRAIIEELRTIPNPSQHIWTVGEGIIRVTDSVRFLLENRHSENGTLQSELRRIEVAPGDMGRICSELGVPSIPDGILYMGGVARIIARKLLDIPDNPFDVLRDLDLYAIGAWTNRVTLRDELRSRLPEWSAVEIDLEGIQTIPDCRIETLAQIIANRDCSLNEILVSGSELYITERAIESLESGIISLGNQPRSAYGVNWQNGVPTMRLLYRIIKFVVEGKATWFSLPKEAIWGIPSADHYWFILLTRVLETKPLRLRDVRMHRLCRLMTDLGIVSGKMPEDILGHWALEILLSEKDIEWYLTPADEEREMKWLSGKLAKAVEKNVVRELGMVEAPLSEANADDSQNVEFRIAEVHDVSPNFAWMVDALARKFEIRKREVSEKMGR